MRMGTPVPVRWDDHLLTHGLFSLCTSGQRGGWWRRGSYTVGWSSRSHVGVALRCVCRSLDSGFSSIHFGAFMVVVLNFDFKYYLTFATVVVASKSFCSSLPWDLRLRFHPRIYFPWILNFFKPLLCRSDGLLARRLQTTVQVARARAARELSLTSVLRHGVFF
jgi:hypothetical protein